MAITYTWQLTGLKKQNVTGLDGVVVQTYWKKIGTDEAGNTGEFAGATPFNPAQVDPANFTTFESLTEAQVLGWIQAVVTGSYEQHVNEQIERQIAERINPVVDIQQNQFPWSPPQSVPTQPGA